MMRQRHQRAFIYILHFQWDDPQYYGDGGKCAYIFLNNCLKFILSGASTTNWEEGGYC